MSGAQIWTDEQVLESVFNFNVAHSRPASITELREAGVSRAYTRRLERQGLLVKTEMLNVENLDNGYVAGYWHLGFYQRMMENAARRKDNRTAESGEGTNEGRGEQEPQVQEQEAQPVG